MSCPDYSNKLLFGVLEELLYHLQVVKNKLLADYQDEVQRAHLSSSFQPTLATAQMAIEDFVYKIRKLEIYCLSMKNPVYYCLLSERL